MSKRVSVNDRVQMYLRVRKNVINGLVQKVFVRCQIRSWVPGSHSLTGSSTCMVSDGLPNMKEHTYFFVTVIKSCVLRYVLRASYNSSSEGFGLLLGPANTVVAIENVDIGRMLLDAGCGGPPKFSAGDIERFMVAELTDMRWSGGGGDLP